MALNPGQGAVHSHFVAICPSFGLGHTSFSALFADNREVDDLHPVLARPQKVSAVGAAGCIAEVYLHVPRSIRNPGQDYHGLPGTHAVRTSGSCSERAGAACHGPYRSKTVRACSGSLLAPCCDTTWDGDVNLRFKAGAVFYPFPVTSYRFVSTDIW